VILVSVVKTVASPEKQAQQAKYRGNSQDQEFNIHKRTIAGKGLLYFISIREFQQPEREVEEGERGRQGDKEIVKPKPNP